VGVPRLAVYSATKWAVWGLTEALRHEQWNRKLDHIRFSSVHPNYVRTGLFAGAGLQGLGGVLVPRLRDHDVVAGAIVEGALKRGRYVVKRPRSLRLTTLFRAFLPDSLFQLWLRLFQMHTSMQGWAGFAEGLNGHARDTGERIRYRHCSEGYSDSRQNDKGSHHDVNRETRD
jgi:all-trans-retinol dehydrogenase (NAD+)